MTDFDISIVDVETDQIRHQYKSTFVPRKCDEIGWTEYPADVTYSGPVHEVTVYVDTGVVIVLVEVSGGCG